MASGFSLTPVSNSLKPISSLRLGGIPRFHRVQPAILIAFEADQVAYDTGFH